MISASIYLNPNLTFEEADKIYKESVKRRKDAVDKALEAAKDMPPKQSSEYLSTVASCIAFL